MHRSGADLDLSEVRWGEPVGDGGGFEAVGCGAKPVMLDLLDTRAVGKAVLENEPEAIVHEATALANAKFGRDFDAEFATTNELRTKGTDALLGAAREAGVRVRRAELRLLPVRAGGRAGQERGRSARPHPAANAQQSFAAMAYLEKVVSEFGGIVLRYGLFYGAPNDGLIEPVRKRQYPIVGDGGGITSWIHLQDATAATVLALEQDGPAIYNIVDDEPAPVRSGCRCSSKLWTPSRRGASPPGSRG